MANRRCIGKNVRLLSSVCQHFPRITTTFPEVYLTVYTTHVNLWHPQQQMATRVSSQSYFYEKIIFSLFWSSQELHLIWHRSINSCLCRIRVILLVFIHSKGIHSEQSHSEVPHQRVLWCWFPAASPWSATPLNFDHQPERRCIFQQDPRSALSPSQNAPSKWQEFLCTQKLRTESSHHYLLYSRVLGKFTSFGNSVLRITSFSAETTYQPNWNLYLWKNWYKKSYKESSGQKKRCKTL